MNDDSFENEKKGFLDKFIENIRRNVNDLTTEGDIVAALAQLDFTLEKLLHFQQNQAERTKLFHDKLTKPESQNIEPIRHYRELSYCAGLWDHQIYLPTKKGYIIRIFHIRIVVPYPSQIELFLMNADGTQNQLEYGIPLSQFNSFTLKFNPPFEMQHEDDQLYHAIITTSDQTGSSKSFWFLYGEYMRVRYE